MPWVGSQYVTVVFPDQTHLLDDKKNDFDVAIVYFYFVNGNVPCFSSCSVYILYLIGFAILMI